MGRGGPRRIPPAPFVTWRPQFARRKLLKLVTAAKRKSKKSGKWEKGQEASLKPLHPSSCFQGEKGRGLSCSMLIAPSPAWTKLLHWAIDLQSRACIVSDPATDFRRTGDELQESLPVGKQGKLSGQCNSELSMSSRNPFKMIRTQLPYLANEGVTMRSSRDTF